jgi:hypothetical protein
MNDELIDFIVENGIREVISDEPVYAGVRPLVVHYTWENQVVVETFTYTHPADSAYWAGGESVKELQVQEGFAVIEI